MLTFSAITTRRAVVNPIRHTFSSLTSLVAEIDEQLVLLSRNRAQFDPSDALIPVVQILLLIELESVYSRTVMSHLSCAVVAAIVTLRDLATVDRWRHA